MAKFINFCCGVHKVGRFCVNSVYMHVWLLEGSPFFGVVLRMSEGMCALIQHLQKGWRGYETVARSHHEGL